MDVRELEDASFAQHQAWLAACEGDLDALDAAAESMVGVPNVEDALERSRARVDELTREVARWRGTVRALEEIVTRRPA